MALPWLGIAAAAIIWPRMSAWDRASAAQSSACLTFNWLAQKQPVHKPPRFRRSTGQVRTAAFGNSSSLPKRLKWGALLSKCGGHLNGRFPSSAAQKR